eukprot:1167082-Ditylum_brightwellii.AAC.1
MSAPVGAKNATKKKDGAKSGHLCRIFLSIMGTLCLALQLHLYRLQKSFGVQNEGWAHQYHPMHEINSAQQKRPPTNRNNSPVPSVIDIHAIADKWKLSWKKKKNGSSNDIISLLEKASQ